MLSRIDVRRIGRKRSFRAICDDVASELARLVASAPAASVARETAPAPLAAAPSSQEGPLPAVSPRGAVEWRLGARFLASNHGTDDAPATLGGAVFGSVELPWGLRRTLLEVGVGTFSTAVGRAGPVSFRASSIQ